MFFQTDPDNVPDNVLSPVMSGSTALLLTAKQTHFKFARHLNTYIVHDVIISPFPSRWSFRQDGIGRVAMSLFRYGLKRQIQVRGQWLSVEAGEPTSGVWRCELCHKGFRSPQAVGSHKKAYASRDGRTWTEGCSTWPQRVMVRPPVARLCRSLQGAWQRQPVKHRSGDVEARNTNTGLAAFDAVDVSPTVARERRARKLSKAVSDQQ